MENSKGKWIEGQGMVDLPLPAEEMKALYKAASPYVYQAWCKIVDAQKEVGWKDFYYMVLKMQDFNPDSYRVVSEQSVKEKIAGQDRVIEALKIKSQRDRRVSAKLLEAVQLTADALREENERLKQAIKLADRSCDVINVTAVVPKAAKY